MPQFGKLTPAEVAELTRRRTNIQDLEEYLSFLEALQAGDWASVELSEGEIQRTVKRRMSIAASIQGKQIRWRAQRGPGPQTLVFQVTDSTPTAKPARRRSTTKKA